MTLNALRAMLFLFSGFGLIQACLIAMGGCRHSHRLKLDRKCIQRTCHLTHRHKHLSSPASISWPTSLLVPMCTAKRGTPEYLLGSQLLGFPPGPESAEKMALWDDDIAASFSEVETHRHPADHNSPGTAILAPLPSALPLSAPTVVHVAAQRHHPEHRLQRRGRARGVLRKPRGHDAAGRQKF